MPEKSHKTRSGKITLGVIGLGHWGPNYLRILQMLPDASVLCAADPDPARLRALRPRYPEIRLHSDHRRVLEDKDVRAVVVATPSSTHHQLVTDALAISPREIIESLPDMPESGRHCAILAVSALYRAIADFLLRP